MIMILVGIVTGVVGICNQKKTLANVVMIWIYVKNDLVEGVRKTRLGKIRLVSAVAQIIILSTISSESEM